MSEIRTFKVKGVGVGKPDYTDLTSPTKTIVGLDQEKWGLLVTRSGMAHGSEVIPAYTVPAHRKLNLGGGVITCNASCIQKVVLTYTPGIVGDYRYDMKGQIVFGALSSTVLTAGDVLTIILYNNDTVARDFSISLVGVLEIV